MQAQGGVLAVQGTGIGVAVILCIVASGEAVQGLLADGVGSVEDGEGN